MRQFKIAALGLVLVALGFVAAQLVGDAHAQGAEPRALLEVNGTTLYRVDSGPASCFLATSDRGPALACVRK
jgi:hypothetical protein